MRGKVIEISKESAWYPFSSQIIGREGEISHFLDWENGWFSFNFMPDDAEPEEIAVGGIWMYEAKFEELK